MTKAGRVLILVLLCGAAASCRSGGEAASAKPREGGGALSVRVASVTARDVEYTVRALGSLEADELVQIAAQVDGAVTQVLFHERGPRDRQHGPGAHRYRDLHDAVEAGEFREDLLQRLDLFRANLPPLRERGGDILKLAEHLLIQLCRQHHLPRRQITEEGKRRLLAYRWPGNVRTGS